MFGTPPSALVDKDSNMVDEVAAIVLERYEKVNFGLCIPRCFDDLKSKDANFETSQSNTLQPLILFYTNNIVSETVCAIFVHTKVKNLNYIEAEERGNWQMELFRDVLEFKKEEVNIYKDKSKKEIIEILGKLKARADKFQEEKEDNKVLAIAVINIGFCLDLDYQPHTEIANQANYVAPDYSTKDYSQSEEFYALTTEGEPICLTEFTCDIAKNKKVHIIQLYDDHPSTRGLLSLEHLKPDEEFYEKDSDLKNKERYEGYSRITLMR